MTPSSDGPGARTGRLLVGWLDDKGAQSFGPDAVTLRSLHGEPARAAVALRTENPVPSADAVGPRPALDAHERRLHEADATLRVDGYTLRWVALDDLRVRQIAVALDEDDVAHSDVSADELADVTVPVSVVTPPVAVFDERTTSWILRGARSSLEVVGRFSGPAPSGDPQHLGVGFVISVQPSRLCVLDVDGALVILDGHHRAAALVRAGVTHAPALVRTGTPRDLETGEGVPTREVLGSRPPRLADYFNDEVAVDIAMPATTSIVVLQATELRVPEL